MNRYALIHSKMKREFVLLQGTGCRYQKCTFCDYYLDTSPSPYEVNETALSQVTGAYGVLDVINSGSAMELDAKTIALIQKIVRDKNIKTLWFEAHYMYKNDLQAFAEQFKGCAVKFRCGVETFDAQQRKAWRKGIPEHVTPKDVAKYFNGVCLLVCAKGQTREGILSDIATASRLFEYFSVNVFCENATATKRDEELAEWFAKEVLPLLAKNEKADVLLTNQDLGVG